MCYHQYSQQRHYGVWHSLHASFTPQVPCLDLVSFRHCCLLKTLLSAPLFRCQQLLPEVRHICPLGWPPQRTTCPASLLLWLKQDMLGHHLGVKLSSQQSWVMLGKRSSWDLQTVGHHLTPAILIQPFWTWTNISLHAGSRVQVLLCLRPAYWRPTSSWIPRWLFPTSV